MNDDKQKYDIKQIPVEEMLPIVAKLTERYTAGESTSVTYEKAEQLMGAVLYCIREAGYEEEDEECRETDNAGNGQSECGMYSDEMKGGAEKTGTMYPAVCKKGMSAQQAYEAGLVRVEKKVKAALALYNALSLQFDSYGNRCLNDTFVKGIPEFFKWYDMRFAPQDTILMLDYPIQKDLSAYTGIDRIYEYLRCIKEEQEFLHSFCRNDVIDALTRYNPSYEEMIDNVCGAVAASIH